MDEELHNKFLALAEQASMALEDAQTALRGMFALLYKQGLLLQEDMEALERMEDDGATFGDGQA